MKPDRLKTIVLAAIAASPSATPALAQQDIADPHGHDPAALTTLNKAPPYSPNAGRNFPDRPLFGETHLHTTLSFDAGTFGARLGPRDAYRFAKGQEIVSNTGQPVRISRPLDFTAVTDHSDNMGFFNEFAAGNPDILANAQAKGWYDLMQSGKGAEAAIQIITAFSNGSFPIEIMSQPGTKLYQDTWKDIIAAAEEANDPGKFTALIAYEWTSQVGTGDNLHRNVIYRDGGDLAVQMDPMVTLPPHGSQDPVDLWKWMGAYEQKTGGHVLAIAHNGNLSNGLMFPTIEQFGKPVDADYVAERARWEKLYEVTQTKGTGETHPNLSPNDEFADFEIWDKGNLTMTVAKKPEMLQHEYTRMALLNGMKLETQFGTNPYKFGLVGSTDSHLGFSSFEEDNFFGKTVSMEPSPERIAKPFVKTDIGTVSEWEVGAAGLAGVWAVDNTRVSIFDAMERKETYATTGTRITVRFFGGWDFGPGDAETRRPAQVGYSKGVPMGGDLVNAPAGKSPSFLVAALKDPIGANLDRVQIIKGWIDAEGNAQESVHDVAWGDATTRKPDAAGKLPSVGTTVDIADASYTNTIGDPELIAVWTDPDFDPALKAFYYARVIEIPTPRWTARDAKFYGLTPGQDVRMTITERAFTSPIWYIPSR
ncbi:DUF3604 domain-containing protein [Paracoccus litorisediminis]|uniref:DUF3604 domain-containing protein n=1 Tax=Paracoccus litorisediminis TaxID=2006130 RepID=A0A844HTH8_9RHOB|nr:DUF3604 domain-containing protein [Paracoccus litorisediminis]MTH61525.1 DUF3604 domain-containing protein [Paracoccus litorisediminis]